MNNLLITHNKTNLEIIKNDRDLDFDHFTKRELEILSYVISGFSAKKIGLFLKISHRTVEKYIENLRAKLKCKNKTELALACFKNKLVQEEIIA
jgi:DNA-binding NarL/FixJ family response regulator